MMDVSVTLDLTSTLLALPPLRCSSVISLLFWPDGLQLRPPCRPTNRSAPPVLCHSLSLSHLSLVSSGVAAHLTSSVTCCLKTVNVSAEEFESHLQGPKILLHQSSSAFVNKNLADVLTST